jgi:hypothetical protein
MPVVKSIILCDNVLQDPHSEKVHLVGVFNAIRPQADPPFPHRQQEFSVFLQLTDADGEAVGQVVARKANSGRIVFTSPSHRLEFLDRLQVKWVRFRIRDCPFPEPGLYWIQFYCDQQLLAEQRLFLLR